LLYFVSVYPYINWAKPYYANFDANMRKIISNGNFGVIFEKDGVALLKRGTGDQPPFVAASMHRPAIAHPVDQTLGPIKYLGWNDPIAPNSGYRLYFSKTGIVSGQPLAMINGKINLLGNGLYGPAEWKSGEVVVIENFNNEPPADIKLVKVQGGLYVNGDGSLSLKIKTDPWF